MKKRTIIYVNYSPYENTGKILDYLFENYENVLLFSLNFHKLQAGYSSNKLFIYNKRRLVKHYNLFQIPTNEVLLYILLPIRSVINLVQMFYYIYFLKKQFRVYDDYFTVNAFTAWIGIILKKLGFVDRTIFWVWDYYPPHDRKKVIVVMRWIYWQFDKYATANVDKLVFLNKRLVELRKKINILPSKFNPIIIPIGTSYEKVPNEKNLQDLRLIFIGVVKKSQGLDLIFESQDDILRKYKKLTIDIIGSGPDLMDFKEYVKLKGLNVNFYGLMNTESKKFKSIIKKSSIGIATYKPEIGNVSYFGDPSKIKLYMSYGLPVITTDVFEFSKEIKKNKSGIVIPYFKKSFTHTIDKILNDYSSYVKNTKNLSKKYNYKDLYKKMFV